VPATVVASVLVFSSTAGASALSPNATAAPETTSLTVPTPAASAAEGPEVYAAAAGFYKRYGLTVATPVSDSGTVLSEFTAGAVRIDGVGQLQTAALYSKGFPVQVIGCTVLNLAFHMFAASSITSVKDLIGKSIGTTALGSGHELAEEVWLVKNGVNPSQVKFVPLGSVPDILAALESGSIAAGGLSYPVWASAQTDPHLHFLGLAPIPPSPDVVNSQWAKGNANTIVAYLEGTIEGFYSYVTNEKAALPVLANFLNLNLSVPADKAEVVKGYETYLPPATQPLTACPSDYLKADVLPYIPAAEGAEIGHDASGFVNTSYLNTVIDNGFYTKLQSEYGAIKGFTPPS
jgi:ABC-type nitrate/sulfonate/bicarbonate transport system substrate-binding protein